MVQPTYHPVFFVDVTQDSDRAPATVSVTGEVRDYGVGCGIKFLEFDFGDGATWKSPDVNSSVVPVDTRHTYTCPGSYTITGTAVSVDWCGNLTGIKTWSVTLTQPTFAPLAVQTPGGPPYGVYLQTDDDIRMDHLSTATVEWSTGMTPEAANWQYDGDVYRTPVHTYTEGGYRDIVVTHHMGGRYVRLAKVARPA